VMTRRQLLCKVPCAAQCATNCLAGVVVSAAEPYCNQHAATAANTAGAWSKCLDPCFCPLSAQLLLLPGHPATATSAPAVHGCLCQTSTDPHLLQKIREQAVGVAFLINKLLLLRTHKLSVGSTCHDRCVGSPSCNSSYSLQLRYNPEKKVAALIAIAQPAKLPIATAGDQPGQPSHGHGGEEEDMSNSSCSCLHDVKGGMKVRSYFS
jgi:hypothetical protein